MFRFSYLTGISFRPGSCTPIYSDNSTSPKRQHMKGIIFDMDGTMVDNMMVHHRAWQRQLAALGLQLTLEEVRQEIHGVNIELLERIFGSRFSEEERMKISNQKEQAYREIFLPELALIDGLSAFLDELIQQGLPIAIGTAAPVENVDFVLDNLGIRHYFQAIFHAGDVRKGKPDPEIFLLAAKSLGLKGEECLVFEDSPTGAEAAYRAGSKACIITTTHSQEEFQNFPHILTFVPSYQQLSLSQLKKLWTGS